MRTDETYLVQVAEREIPCQCGTKCIAKPPPSTLTQVGERRPPPPPTHAMPDQHMLCVMRYVSDFVTERIRELRTRAGSPLPKDVYLLYGDEVRTDLFKDAVRKYLMLFAESETELDQIIISNFTDVCDLAVHRARVST